MPRIAARLKKNVPSQLIANTRRHSCVGHVDRADGLPAYACGADEHIEPAELRLRRGHRGLDLIAARHVPSDRQDVNGRSIGIRVEDREAGPGMPSGHRLSLRRFRSPHP